jgi:hypothetical protein
MYIQRDTEATTTTGQDQIEQDEREHGTWHGEREETSAKRERETKRKTIVDTTEQD